MHIVDLQQSHWEDAAALVCERVTALRRTLPDLPASYTQPAVIYDLLAELAAQVPGVAALDRGRLVGFLVGKAADNLRGGRGVFVPEWANAAALDRARSLYPAMYAALAPRWVAAGRLHHAITVLANDRGGLDGLYWQGFGLLLVDALRDLTPPAGQTAEQAGGLAGGSTGEAGSSDVPGVTIRRATLADVEAVAPLVQGVQRHLASAPIFMPLLALDSPAQLREWMAPSDSVVWVAEQGGELVAQLWFGPSNPTACTIMRDAGTTSIMSAYTLPRARSGGLARAILHHALAGAKEAGYVRCAVDFESSNIEGAAFWLRHFQPICFSVLRCVDPRMPFGPADRPATELW